MKGSEKQIKWAEDIKNSFVKTLDEILTDVPEDRAELAKKVRAEIIEDIDAFENAEDIIVRRDMLSSDPVRGMITQYMVDYATGKRTIQKL